MRHGRHVFWALLLLITPAVSGQSLQQVGSDAFDVEYIVNDDAKPLDTVALWYTVNQGSSWIEYGLDPDARPPMTFRAAREGLHGFFLVLTNASGSSSPPPEPGTSPQLSVFVDKTAPSVELHTVRQIDALGNRTLQLRWTAIDRNFPERPVRLDFRLLPDRPWRAMVDEALTNTGWYDWAIPDEIQGPAAIRVTVADRSGRVTSSEAETIDIQGPPAGSTAIVQVPSSRDQRGTADVGVQVEPGNDERAQRLMTQAKSYRERGQYPDAISRLREAVRLKPRWTDAFVEMGEMLYHVGDADRALNAFELALQREPLSRRALRGAAIVHRRRNEHESAARMLRTVLQANPNDAEVWINLGDISVFRGDEVMARECYTRATLVDPAATQVIADAQRRLELMLTVSRTYSTDRR